jgi:hypothetical protein
VCSPLVQPGSTPNKPPSPETAVQIWNLSSRTACGASAQGGTLELTLLLLQLQSGGFAGAPEDFFVAQTLPLAGRFEEIFDGRF